MTAISRGFQSFHHVKSTEPSFESTSGPSGLYKMESTGTNRYWQPIGASGKAIRVSSKAADDFYVALGSSLTAATSSGAMLVLGGTVETFMVPAGQAYVGVASSTDVVVNFTLGFGQ